MLIFWAIRLLAFQLTRSRGAWLLKIIKNCQLILFQLTRSRGAWLHGSMTITLQSIISTHTLTWSVTMLIVWAIRLLTFQLTRSRGAWQLHFLILSDDFQFQLTRSRGAWPSAEYTPCFRKLFQLTRSRGAWRKGVMLKWQKYHFNSHAHVERDPCKYYKPDEVRNFNSHAHVERDSQN